MPPVPDCKGPHTTHLGLGLSAQGPTPKRQTPYDSAQGTTPVAVPLHLVHRASPPVRVVLQGGRGWGWGGLEPKVRNFVDQQQPKSIFPFTKFHPLCGDTWVCHVVIASKRIAQATACTAKKKEIKADHEPEWPVLGQGGP